MHIKAGAELRDNALMRKINTEVLPHHIKYINILFSITLNKNTQYKARFNLRYSYISVFLVRKHSEMSVRLSKLELLFSQSQFIEKNNL